MPQRRRMPASSVGAITKLCPGCCDSRIQTSQAVCPRCWPTVPRHLQVAWQVAKDGDCDSGPALERALAAIEAHVRKVSVR